MKKVLFGLIILLVAGVGTAAYFYFSSDEPNEQFITLKGTVQDIAADQNYISILSEGKEWKVEITETTKMVDKDQNPLTVNWLNKNWQIQVSGSAQKNNSSLNAKEIILLESVELPEEIKSNSAFKEWLADWQVTWLEVKPEDFKKTRTEDLKPTLLAVDESHLATIPNFEQGKIFSPDNDKYVSYVFYWGEPDSNVIISNRQNEGKIEQLAFCGTVCTFDGAFWLDDNRVAVTEVSEVADKECAIECPETLVINIFDFNRKTTEVYEAKKSAPELRNRLLGLRCEAIAPCLSEYGIYENSKLASPLVIRLIYPKAWVFEENNQLKLVDFKSGNKSVSLQIFIQDPTELITNFVANPKRKIIDLIGGKKGTEVSGETLKGDGTKISHTIVARGNYWFALSGSPEDAAYATMRDSLIIR